MSQLNFEAGFQALPQAAAVVDEQGAVVATNAAWRAFAGMTDGFPLPGAVEGSYYLNGAAQAVGVAPEFVGPAAAGLRSVLADGRQWVEIEYPWRQSDSTRWFLMRAQALQAPAKGALVIQVELTGQRQDDVDRLGHNSAWTWRWRLPATGPGTGICEPGARSFRLSIIA